MWNAIYSKSGGYHLFIQKIQELKKKYYEEPRKGIQGSKITCMFCEVADLFETAECPQASWWEGLHSRHMFLQQHIREGCHTRYVLLTHQRQCIHSVLEFTLDNHFNHSVTVTPCFSWTLRVEKDSKTELIIHQCGLKTMSKRQLGLSSMFLCPSLFPSPILL